MNGILSMTSNPFQTHVFLEVVIEVQPYHMPLKYRCLVKISTCIRHTYVTPLYGNSMTPSRAWLESDLKKIQKGSRRNVYNVIWQPIIDNVDLLTHHSSSHKLHTPLIRTRRLNCPYNPPPHPPNYVDYWVKNGYHVPKKHDLLFFSHVSFWYPLLKPRQTTCHSNIGLLMRNVTE